MRSLLCRLALVSVLSLAVGLAACAQQEEEGEPGAEDTTAMAPPAEMPAPEPAAASAELVVSNPMPHAMIVSIDEAGLVTELGTVPANGQGTFSISVPVGAPVTVSARDEANTHTPTSTIMVAEGETSVSWTIE
jgi:hypothetical protein